jgi:hypothetical protein
MIVLISVTVPLRIVFRQSSAVVIVKEEVYEPSIANTSKVAPKSSLIGVLTVKVRADWL